MQMHDYIRAPHSRVSPPSQRDSLSQTQTLLRRARSELCVELFWGCSVPTRRYKLAVC
jgi:hypothetical protein